MKPYLEKQINSTTKIRKFSSKVPEDMLVWHRDRQDRVVEVICGKGWMFQKDGSVPVQLIKGAIFEVRANEWHRLIKGESDLGIRIVEGKIKKSDKPHPSQYDAPDGSKRDKDLDRCKKLYKDGKIQQAAKCRQKMEEPHMDEYLLRETINDISEEIHLDQALKELENRIQEKKGKSPKDLSKAVKKSLDKKADKRCLTRGSVYAEFRAGLAAFLSSGSRKGMSAHQWAHARVNSAQPRKKWAKVKKRKKCKKKKR